MTSKSTIKRWWQTMKWAVNYPDASMGMKVHVFLDYLKLYNQKGLTQNEYHDFEFDKQPEEFRQTFLGLNEQRYYLDYLSPIKYYSLARNKYLTHKSCYRLMFFSLLPICIYFYAPHARKCNSLNAQTFSSTVPTIASK